MFTVNIRAGVERQGKTTALLEGGAGKELQKEFSSKIFQVHLSH